MRKSQNKWKECVYRGVYRSIVGKNSRLVGTEAKIE